MTKGQAWSGITTKNHISTLFGSKPELISKLTTVLLQASGAKNLDTTLSKFPTKKLSAGTTEFAWKVATSDERSIPLVEARYNGKTVEDSDEGIGKGRSLIELVYPEKHFTKMHLIVGHRPDVYQYRIIDEPYEEGTNYVYTVELWGAEDSLLGVPGDEFTPGNRFSIDGSPVESEFSTQGSGIAFSSPYALRNTVTNMRFEHKVSGKLIDCKMEPVYSSNIVTVDPNTKKARESKTWMQEIYWRFEKAISTQKARTLMFGRTNRDINGKFLNVGNSNCTIEAGSGIREQMELSNTVTYNRFNVRILEDMLSELSEGKLDWGERKFIVRTGERGAAQFHRAVTADASGWGALNFANTNTNGIQGTTSQYHTNAYSAGFQFTEFKAPNNIHVIVEVDPMYDDKVRNKILHPEGGVLESYRYDIMQIGSMAEPNIQKIEVEGGGEIRGYMAGIRDPFSGRKGGVMNHMEDSATMTAMVEGFGAVVLDSGRTATLKCVMAA